MLLHGISELAERVVQHRADANAEQPINECCIFEKTVDRGGNDVAAAPGDRAEFAPADHQIVPSRHLAISDLVAVVLFALPVDARPDSQFFIMLGDSPHLDNQYSIWGQVTSGMEFVDMIKKGNASRNGSVSDPDNIVTFRVAADVEK